MRKLGIVAIEYLEPYWQEIKRDILNVDVPTVFVNRQGVGSMAKAYNEGFKALMKIGGFEYVWFLSNAFFNPGDHLRLIEQMDKTKYAIIHASFPSGHVFCNSLHKDETIECPFVEFTAPIVRVDVFKQFQLDEQMPYWGHDLDWCHKARSAGYKVGVYHGVELRHTYIQKNKDSHPITKKRSILRKSTDKQTSTALALKYGKDWRKKVWEVSL